MATLRAHAAGRDRELFVARQAELDYFESVFGGASEHRVVHVVGVGGIGKSTLMREVARRATEHSIDTFWIDGRDLPPFPVDVERALQRVADSTAALVVFDSYELISSLDSHLRDNVLPELPDTTTVVFVSRQHPSRGWFERGWDTVVHTLEVGPLEPDDAATLVRKHGVGSDVDVDEIVRRSHGSPLALVVGAEPSSPGVADLAERLLGEEVDADRHRILSVAAVARVTTPELLAEVLGEADPSDSYKWLADRTFSEPLATGVTLHSLVAEAVRERIRRVDPDGEAMIRRRVADHLHRLALAGNDRLSTDLQHLVSNEDVRWGFASDVGNRYRIDKVRRKDADVIGAILEAAGVGEWWELTQVFFHDHPECCGVARDANGRVGGYFVATSPGHAPAAAESDPLLGPWLRHCREVLSTNRAVLYREAVDLTGEMGEITSLLGAGGMFATGVPNPRYVMLPISPVIPAAQVFADALGAVHLPDLDLAAHGMDLQCHLVDFGHGGLIGFQRDWIYRETGVPPPEVEPEIDPARLVRWLREPSELSRGPAWLGETPAERLASLRDRVTAALVVFGAHQDDQLARTIVEAAFLGDAAPHEAIARRLHLSRSAYFRRLQSASERVGAELLAVVKRDH